MNAQVPLAILLAASTLPAAAVEFDCVPIPAPNVRPAECDDPGHPSYDPINVPPWCNCLTTGLTSLRGGQPAAFEQAIIEVWREPTIGKYTLTVGGGTLDLSGVQVDDRIGQLLVDVPGATLGLAENFLLDFQLVVTEVLEGQVLFDVVVVRTNQTSRQVLRYDPLDELHAFGLTYRGSVEAFGANSGFQLTYEYVLPEDLPFPAVHTGVQIGDLTRPGFTVPVLFTFPTEDLFVLPPSGVLTVDTLAEKIYTAAVPGQREFGDSFTIQPQPRLPAAPTGLTAAAGDGRVDLDWADNAEADLQGYNVYRSTADGGPYGLLAGPLAVSAYADAAVVNGTTYHYVVRARSPAGESASSAQVSATPASAAPRLRRGDANRDGIVDLSDAISTLEALFLGGAALRCPDSGDTNDDGQVDLSDAISTLSYLFLGGGTPPQPGPRDCGTDPTEDLLGTCEYTC